MVRTMSFALSVALLVSLLWAAPPPRAFAGGVVGTGTPASCTEAALNAALAGGGTITFNCGAAPHTIILAVAKPIAENTEIQGGGLITLSGNSTTSLFQVFFGKTLSLRDITLRQAHGTFGAVQNFGTLNLINSQLVSNVATADGGAIDNHGVLNLTNSVLAGNFASVNGGGILNDGGAVTIQGSDIYSNTASSGRGGGIYNASNNSSVTLKESTLRDNSANIDGGGLYNSGVLTVMRSTIRGNRSLAGAGVYVVGPTWLDLSTVHDNSAYGNAGGLYNGAVLTITHSTISGNRSRDGGGVMNYSGAQLWAWNSTIDGNTARAIGGGVYNVGVANLYNVTISHNVADSDDDGFGAGGGVYNQAGGTFNTRNTLLAVNYRGISPALHDCSGVIWSAHSRFTSVPPSCSIVGPSSFATDPNGIGPLADNGGPTQTVALLPGSDAIDASDTVQGCVNYNSVLPTDQRGAPRIAGARCDVGAFEFGSLLPRLFLPLLIR